MEDSNAESNVDYRGSTQEDSEGTISAMANGHFHILLRIWLLFALVLRSYLRLNLKVMG